jgi:cation/acetate symporter
VKVLGHTAPIFPYDPAAIVTVPLAFAVTIAVSRRSRAIERSGAPVAYER